MVALADADLLASACDTALIVTMAGLGTDDGAAYRPVALIVPKVVLPPAIPFTFQFT